MWVKQKSRDKEQMALLTDKGVYFLPDNKNTQVSAHYDYFQYQQRQDGKRTFTVNGQTLTVLGVIHTHPSDSQCKPCGGYLSSADYNVAAYFNAPIFVIDDTGGIRMGRPLGKVGEDQIIYHNHNFIFDCTLGGSNMYSYL